MRTCRNAEAGGGRGVTEQTLIVQPLDVYPEANCRIELASGQGEVALTVKTWGSNFTNRPVVLKLGKQQAEALLHRLQKAVNGLI